MPVKTKDIPPHIAAVLKEKVPPTHKFWIMRVIVMDASPVERPSHEGKSSALDLLLKVADIDSAGDGYDIRLHGSHHDIERNDALHLVGHEPIEAKNISFPRLCVSHNTGLFARVYPDVSRLPYGELPTVQWQYWLSIWTPAGLGYRLRNLWILLGLPLIPSLLFGSIFGYVIGLIVLLVAVVFALPLIGAFWFGIWYMKYVSRQPPFTHEKTDPPRFVVKNLQDFLYFKRTDLTKVYEYMAFALFDWVAKNPDLENDFPGKPRGANTIGGLD